MPLVVVKQQAFYRRAGSHVTQLELENEHGRIGVVVREASSNLAQLLKDLCDPGQVT